MYIADTLRKVREEKQLSQGDIERRTGLKRCYVSRVEHGHTVPSIETLEKISRALETPMYQLFYLASETSHRVPAALNGRNEWTSSRSGQRYLEKLTHSLSRMSGKDRATLLFTAVRLVKTHRRR